MAKNFNEVVTELEESVKWFKDLTSNFDEMTAEQKIEFLKMTSTVKTQAEEIKNVLWELENALDL